MTLWRIQLSTRFDQVDPLGRQVAATLRSFGLGSIETVRTARLFTIELPDTMQCQRTVVERIAGQLLADPVTEDCRIYWPGEMPTDPAGATAIEVHLKAGVMDNVANSTLFALEDMGIDAASVRTARRYELHPAPGHEDLERIRRLIGNDCIEEVIIGTKPIEPPPAPPGYDFKLRHVPIGGLDDSGLEQLSRQGHLFLSLPEMRTIQAHYRAAGRDPTDLELETLAQTWSEHCVHKTLRSAIEYRGAPFPNAAEQHHPKSPRSAKSPQFAKSPRPWSGGPAAAEQRHDLDAPPFVKKYDNLLKDTIARATDELIKAGRGPTCLSVFEDNAGIIAFDDDWAIAFKVETHNHPSAIEPYGGAATGIGGCIRDILGSGLGAKPIANTDVFCVAPPDWPMDAVPRGVIHPKITLQGIVAGVRDYGNRMGIPTVNGAIHFDPRYLGNPLVYCGCVGLIPRDRVAKAARPGEAIVLLGGRTGRDGIHGATFSSAELTDTHVDEFAHAVQIGNPIEEKKILDVILQARDYVPPEPPADSPNPQSAIRNPRPLYSAITDCGAGGLSSAVGEMAAEIGAEVDLETVPLKYAGLRYDEIWISEAQERMVLAVPRENVDLLLALAESEDVEATVIGRFTDAGRLIVRYRGTEVGSLDMRFLHHGLPKTIRQAEWWPDADPSRTTAGPQSPSSNSAIRNPQSTIRNPQSAVPNPRSYVAELQQRLRNPTTASKHWVIRQYDHEVQAGSVVKPLVGVGDGPSDAAVLRPRLSSDQGIALGCGLAPQLGDVDPYWMAVAAVDEALRNVVCVGGDPSKTAILDNFCWPGVDDPRSLGALVRACQACYDVATAYGLPFISGKDSLNNEFALNDADAAMLRRVFADRWPGLANIPPPGCESPTTDPQSPIPKPQSPNRLAIPYTLLISAVSLIEDVNRCITAAPRLVEKKARLFYVGLEAADWSAARLDSTTRLHATVAGLIRSGQVLTAHDCSEGGIAVAVAEMALASDLDTQYLLAPDGPAAHPFAEPPSGYILQATDPAALETSARTIPGVVVQEVARLTPPGGEPRFEFFPAQSATRLDATDPPEPIASVSLADLRRAWTAPLDW